ncbi:hypothetical protein AMTRI_Chr06g172570 [Amborella trichopoda]
MFVEVENQDIETVEMPLSPHSTSYHKRKITLGILKATCIHCQKQVAWASKHVTSHMKKKNQDLS